MSGRAWRNIGKYITVNPNRTVSLSEFSVFKPSHLLIRTYQVPVLLTCPLALSRVWSFSILTIFVGSGWEGVRHNFWEIWRGIRANLPYCVIYLIKKLIPPPPPRLLIIIAQSLTRFHFNLANHFIQHMAVCGLSLHQGNTESRKTLGQNFIFKVGTFNPHGIDEPFSFN